jgi:Fe-S-cluster-containing hydrogenase component 2
MKVLCCKTELCSGCRACEKACSKAYHKDETGAKSAINIINHNRIFLAKKCTQCGECINACPGNALYRDKSGVVRLNKKLCVSCLACVGFCSEHAMFYADDELEPFKCVACGICAKQCPQEALLVLQNI